MDKPDIKEAVPIIQRMLNGLSAIIIDKEDAGIAAAVAIGQTYADAAFLCYTDDIGASLDNCFDLTRQAGCTLQQMGTVRLAVTDEAPVTIGATLVKVMGIFLSFAQQAKIISAMIFVSRDDVETLMATVQKPFADIEETVADSMDNVAYQAIIGLHAAVVNHLVQTARPLPLMLSYVFAESLPSLIISQRLYGDASRYDEIRAENKVIHPAFCPPSGRALSQ
jgi:prophage DNA circulation protein